MGDDLKPLPLTITAPNDPTFPAQMVIGSDSLYLKEKPGPYGGYWFVVIDRKSLKVVYNQFSASSDKAPEIGEYDSSDYILLLSTAGLGTGEVPQGALYDFLYDNGGGRELKRIVQLNNTLGCGTWGWVSYILVGVLGPGRPGIPGIERSNIEYSSAAIVMTAELVPMKIGDEVIYSPSPLGN